MNSSHPERRRKALVKYISNARPSIRLRLQSLLRAMDLIPADVIGEYEVNESSTLSVEFDAIMRHARGINENGWEAAFSRLQLIRSLNIEAVDAWPDSSPISVQEGDEEDFGKCYRALLRYMRNN